GEYVLVLPASADDVPVGQPRVDREMAVQAAQVLGVAEPATDVDDARDELGPDTEAPSTEVTVEVDQLEVGHPGTGSPAALADEDLDHRVQVGVRRLDIAFAAARIPVERALVAAA